MIISRERALLLGGIVAVFVLMSSGYVWWRIRFANNHFRAGQVPQDIVNQLMPKSVPLESLRPPAIRVTDPLRYGGATATLSVIEYGDFQCEFCRQLAPEIKKALEPYDGDVRFVWRDYPIEEIHQNAMGAAVFARCAGLQGRYWEAYDLLMAAGTLNESLYQQIAARLRLDGGALSACRKDPSLPIMLRKDVEEARADGIQSTPLLFIGTKAIEGYVDSATIKKAIDDARASL